MKSEQLKFNSRKDLERRVYINYSLNLVMVWRNEREKEREGCSPYLVLNIEEFKKMFKLGNVK